MVIRRMFSCMLAFVLCFVCTVSVQASSYSGHKKEIKQAVCSLPVMAVDQMNAEYLAVSNAPYECSGRNNAIVSNYNPLYTIMEKCRHRVSRGKYFSAYETTLRNHESKISTLYRNPSARPRLYNLLC